jgi:hypothetical protein
MHAKAARKSGESEDRVFAVAAWRETPYFDAERAASRPCESGGSCCHVIETLSSVPSWSKRQLDAEFARIQRQKKHAACMERHL